MNFLHLLLKPNTKLNPYSIQIQLKNFRVFNAIFKPEKFIPYTWPHMTTTYNKSLVSSVPMSSMLTLTRLDLI